MSCGFVFHNKDTKLCAKAAGMTLAMIAQR
jgi:hypothetical protein